MFNRASKLGGTLTGVCTAVSVVGDVGFDPPGVDPDLDLRKDILQEGLIQEGLLMLPRPMKEVPVLESGVEPAVSVPPSPSICPFDICTFPILLICCTSVKKESYLKIVFCSQEFIETNPF